MGDAMCKKLATIFRQSWVGLLGWVLWLGAYSQTVGAKSELRGLLHMNPQTMYWIATIAAMVVGLVIIAQLIVGFVRWWKRDDETTDIIENLEKVVTKLKERNDK